MRKPIVLVVVALTVLAAVPGTSAAKKKSKTITDSWTATAPVPFPVEVSSCQNGPDTLSTHLHELKTPGKGELTVTMTGFVGDWDLWVFAPNGTVLGSSVNFVDVMTETVTAFIRGMPTVTVMACNFAGGPTAELESIYTYR